MRERLMPRVIAVLVLVLVLAACALTPNQAHTQPDYPPSPDFGAPRDAGRE